MENKRGHKDIGQKLNEKMADVNLTFQIVTLNLRELNTPIQSRMKRSNYILSVRYILRIQRYKSVGSEKVGRLMSCK